MLTWNDKQYEEKQINWVVGLSLGALFLFLAVLVSVVLSRTPW